MVLRKFIVFEPNEKSRPKDAAAVNLNMDNHQKNMHWKQNQGGYSE